MPVSKNAYRRFQLIDEMLQSRQFPSKELIMNYLYEEGYPISISTFEKDLEAMRSKFDLPIEYDRFKGGYYYSDPNVTLNISISSQEMEIIMLALERLKQLHKSKALLNAEKSLQRIMNRLHYNLFDWQGTSRRKITYDPLPDYSSSETLSMIYDAICEKKVLRFRLSTPDISSEEILEPYVLNEFQGKWYIAGLNDGHYVSYSIEMISDLVVTQKRFERIEKISHLKRSGSDVYPDRVAYVKEAHPITVRFDISLLEEIKRNPFQRKQEILEEKSNDFTVLFYANIDLNFIQRVILAFGDKAVVTSPPYAVELTILLLKRMLEKQISFQ